MRAKIFFPVLWTLCFVLAAWGDYRLSRIIPAPALLLIPVVAASWLSGRPWGFFLAAAFPVAHAFSLHASGALPFKTAHLIAGMLMHMITFLLVAELVHRVVSQNRVLKKRWDRVLESLPVGVWTTDSQGRVLGSNKAHDAIWEGLPPADFSRAGEYEAWYRKADGASREWRLGAKKTVACSRASIVDEKGRSLGTLMVSQDVTAKKELEEEREALIKSLEEAMKNIKILKGMLPICMGCKSIRDDGGYWKRIEDYLQKHSGVEFSHGLCPDCIEKMYPEFALRLMESNLQPGV